MGGKLDGYIPQVVHHTAAVAAGLTADAAKVQGDTAQKTGRLAVRNRSAVTVERLRLFFKLADFNDNANYITIDAVSEFDEPVEVTEFWLMSESGTPAVEVLFMYRY